MYNIYEFKERNIKRRIEDIWYDCFYIQIYINRDKHWYIDEFENTLRMTFNDLVKRFEHLSHNFPRNKYRIIHIKTSTVVYE